MKGDTPAISSVKSRMQQIEDQRQESGLTGNVTKPFKITWYKQIMSSLLSIN